MSKSHFHEYHIVGLQKKPLSQGEIYNGNSLFLKFMDLSSESEPEIINTAKYHLSYEELMKVALRIDSFWDEKSSWINGKRFNYRHQVLHQILNFNDFYRQTVKFVEDYYKWLTE